VPGKPSAERHPLRRASRPITITAEPRDGQVALSSPIVARHSEASCSVSLIPLRLTPRGSGNWWGWAGASIVKTCVEGCQGTVVADNRLHGLQVTITLRARDGTQSRGRHRKARVLKVYDLLEGLLGFNGRLPGGVEGVVGVRISLGGVNGE